MCAISASTPPVYSPPRAPAAISSFRYYLFPSLSATVMIPSSFHSYHSSTQHSNDVCRQEPRSASFHALRLIMINANDGRWRTIFSSYIFSTIFSSSSCSSLFPFAHQSAAHHVKQANSRGATRPPCNWTPAVPCCAAPATTPAPRARWCPTAAETAAAAPVAVHAFVGGGGYHHRACRTW